MESGQMDIIFKISTSNYIGLQKFEPKQTEPAYFFNYFSILFLHLCSFFYRNQSNIKESGQMDIRFKISTSNYIGLQKFEPKRTEPAQIFQLFFNLAPRAPQGSRQNSGPIGRGSLRSPRALRARRLKKNSARTM